MRRRSSPVPRPERASATAAGLVEVRRCDQAEAVVLKSLFESHAIPTLLRARLAHSVHPFTVGAQGEVVVMVPAREAPRAKRLLIRLVRQPPRA